MSSVTPSVDHDQLVNVFARFFGSLLTQLKHHNLRHGIQSEVHPTYISDSPVEFVSHIK